jgi:hypothetical protein
MSSAFAVWKEELEARCEAAVASEPRTKSEATDGGGHIDWQYCIVCQKPAQFVRVAIGYCAEMESVRYGICAECKGSAKSEDVIVAAQKRAFACGQRPSQAEAQRMCNEAVAFGVADGLISFEPVPQRKRSRK